MPAPEQIVFPAVLGARYSTRRSEDRRSRAVRWPQCRAGTRSVRTRPTSVTPLELVVGASPHRVPGAGRVMRPGYASRRAPTVRGHASARTVAGHGRRRRAGAAWSRSARQRRRWSRASGPSRCRCSTTPRQDQARPARRVAPAGRAQLCSSSPGEMCAPRVASNIRSTAAGSMARPRSVPRLALRDRAADRPTRESARTAPGLTPWDGRLTPGFGVVRFAMRGVVASCAPVASRVEASV